MTPINPDPSPTVELVPLSVATDLASAALAMLKQQRAYFDARRAMPHVNHVEQLRQCQDAERRVEHLARDALSRERVELPGFTG